MSFSNMLVLLTTKLRIEKKLPEFKRQQVQNLVL